MAELSREDLNALEVWEWNSIADQFVGADLLLGNGFSISLNDRFRYDSLFELFLSSRTPQEQDLLRAFETSNFEAILSDLQGAIRVNSIFALETTELERASQVVRKGLVKAVQKQHPRFTEISSARLTAISETLDAFGDVFTTNYDCLLYHVVMRSKDRHDADSTVRPYNDYFWNKVSPRHLKFMDFQSISKYKHVYYLHGALFIFRSGDDDLKLRTSGSSELIDAIETAILSGDIPLFVSEGTPKEKKRAIAKSRYLRFASAALEAERDRIVIFGSSLAAQDGHIIESLRLGTKTAAVSIFVGDKSATELETELYALRARLGGIALTFFDSRSLFA